MPGVCTPRASRPPPSARGVPFTVIPGVTPHRARVHRVSRNPEQPCVREPPPARRPPDHPPPAGTVGTGTATGTGTGPVPVSGSPMAANLTIALGSGAQLLAFYPPQPASAKIAVIVVPGGSYRPGPFGWCKQAEGSDIAQWLASLGMVGLVLHYRLPAGRPHVPLADALKAVQALHEGPRWLLPEMAAVGVMGFSAGGHLAALAATRYTTSSNRPDFALLMYPVISMALENHTHANSRREYLGDAPSEALVAAYSADRQVTRSSPPTFLIHARDDKIVSYRSSRLFYDACAAQAVRATFVELEAGGHPFVNKKFAWLPARTASLAWLCSTLKLHGSRGVRAAMLSGSVTCADAEGCGGGLSGGADVCGDGSLRARLLNLPGVAAVSQTRHQRSARRH